MQQVLTKQFYVYILTNERKNIFYVGITSNLPKRVWEHKLKLVDGFTKKYNVCILVYYEIFEDAELAIKREKRLKRWNRDWKKEAITKFNAEWKDLYEDIAK